MCEANFTGSAGAMEPKGHSLDFNTLWHKYLVSDGDTKTEEKVDCVGHV